MNNCCATVLAVYMSNCTKRVTVQLWMCVASKHGIKILVEHYV
jgi:hypothetical protein